MSTIRWMLLLGCFSFGVNAATEDACKKPELIKPIDNWSIIATNVANINTALYFKGSDLKYSLSFQQIKAPNKADIDEYSGTIKINAETRDNFDLTVTAKNFCGSVTSTFNVQIDEDQ